MYWIISRATVVTSFCYTKCSGVWSLVFIQPQLQVHSKSTNMHIQAVTITCVIQVLMMIEQNNSEHVWLLHAHHCALLHLCATGSPASFWMQSYKSRSLLPWTKKGTPVWSRPGNCVWRHEMTYPERTPSTRLSMKKEPMMMSGMK